MDENEFFMRISKLTLTKAAIKKLSTDLKFLRWASFRNAWPWRCPSPPPKWATRNPVDYGM